MYVMPFDGPELLNDGCHASLMVSAMFGRACNAPTASIMTLASLNLSSRAKVWLMLVSLAISSPVDVSIFSFVICSDASI